MKYKNFEKVRIVSRDVIRDWFQGLRSLFGLRMKAYEERVQETIGEIVHEIKLEGNISWHRINIQEIKDGILIQIYGVFK